jgi:hypothetical protein
MIEQSLVAEFINGFYGFGDLKAPLWFVGMEEGGGNSQEECENRILAWEKLGKQKLVDLVAYHKLINIDKYFVEPVILQSTWNKVIRVILSEMALPHETEDVREYQQNYLGRIGESTALLELMPLASRNIKEWHYSSWFENPVLFSREKYQNTITPRRIAEIRDQIDKQHPRVVIFYGSTYEEYWQKIIRSTLTPHSSIEFKYYERTEVLYISMKHPVATGVTNHYFEQIGEWIRENKCF